MTPPFFAKNQEYKRAKKKTEDQNLIFRLYSVAVYLIPSCRQEDTVTVQVAVKLPLVVVTVIVAVPAAFAVTAPSADTSATLRLSQLQDTVLSAAFSGATVAVSLAVPPTVSESVF